MILYNIRSSRLCISTVLLNVTWICPNSLTCHGKFRESLAFGVDSFPTPFIVKGDGYLRHECEYENKRMI